MMLVQALYQLTPLENLFDNQLRLKNEPWGRHSCAKRGKG